MSTWVKMWQRGHLIEESIFSEDNYFIWSKIIKKTCSELLNKVDFAVWVWNLVLFTSYLICAKSYASIFRSECGNSRIFQSLRFYVKSILGIQELKRLPFWQTKRLWILTLITYCNFLRAEIYQNKNSWVPKIDFP